MARKQKINTDLVLRVVLWVISSLVLAVGAFWALNYAWGGTTLPNGERSRTGTIKLDVRPKGSFSAFLNESPRGITNEEIIDNVLPGMYTLRIQKDGFNSWEKDINVAEGLITDVSVQLFPSEYVLSQITKTNIAHTTFSPDGRFAYYLVNNSPNSQETGLWRHNLEQSILPLIEQAPVKLLNANEISQEDLNNNEFEVIPSPDNNQLLLFSSEKHYLLPTNTLSTLDSNELELSYPIRKIGWMGNTNLLIESDNMLVDYNTTNQTSQIILYEAQSELIYAYNQFGLIIMEDNNLVRYANGTKTVLPLERYIGPQNVQSIILAQREQTKFILKSELGNVYIDLDNKVSINLGTGETLTLSPNSTNVIIQDQEQIVSHNIRFSLSRERLINSQTKLLNVDDIDWQSVKWANNSNYFIFAKKDTGGIFSADKSGKNIVRVLDLEELSGKEPYAISLDNSAMIIQLLDDVSQPNSPQRSNLYKIEFE